MLGRKSRLKERIKNPTTLGVNPMAKVTYRGVVYNTDTKESCSKVKTDLTYRGVQHTEDRLVCAR